MKKKNKESLALKLCSNLPEMSITHSKASGDLSVRWEMEKKVTLLDMIWACFSQARTEVV